MQTTLGFYGGVGTVTGANFMLDTGKVAILVDCGLEQGGKETIKKNATPFVYDPSLVDVLLITHAHADHIGRIPKLFKDGFKGVIYSTTPTLELSRVMLEDALRVMQMEAKISGEEVLYKESDVENSFKLWKAVGYEEMITLPDNIKAWFSNAGHILGSGIISLEREGRKIVFSGDIGNVPQPLLNAPNIPRDYDYLVMESVYGDRVHEEVDERVALLRYYLEETEKKGGTLIIPAFSLERTQGILFEINNLVETGKIKPLPIFLDSPLAIKVTDIYKKFTSYMRTEIQEQIRQGDDIFSFPGLKFTDTVKESEAIDREKGAKVIIAGSGMSHGGRILRHEKRYLSDPKTTLLLVGYQAVGSVGRLLQDGAKSIVIEKEKVKVRAKVAQIQGFSGHADRNQLLEFVAHGSEKAKKIFVTMGEERASLFLAQRIYDYLDLKVEVPSLNQEEIIDF